MGKKITLDFLRGYQLGTRRESDPVAYQYDEGHTLEVRVPSSVTTAEIHYWIRGMEKAEAYDTGDITAEEDGTYTITGNIPNSFFEHSGDLRVYVVVTDDSASVVTYEGYVHIVDRQMPEDYVDDDPENEATRVLIEAQEAAATATAAAETCQEVAESIPEDYSALSQDVTDLKADLSNLTTATSDNIKSIKQHIETGKNLLPFETVEKTINNLTVSYENGKIIRNGTAGSGEVYSLLTETPIALFPGTYQFWSLSAVTNTFYLTNSDGTVYFWANRTGFTITEPMILYLGVRIAANWTGTATNSIMLESGSATTAYEPVISGTAVDNYARRLSEELAVGEINYSCERTPQMYNGSSELRNETDQLHFYKAVIPTGTKTITYNSEYIGATPSHWYNEYDASGNLLYAATLNTSGVTKSTITIQNHDTVAYIKLSMWVDQGELTLNNSVKSMLIPPTFNLISALGDSITYGYSSEGMVTNTYQKMIADTLDAGFQNLGIASTPVCPNSDYTGDQNANAFVYRYNTISANADMIIIAGGTNDFRHNVPLGSETDTDAKYEETFYGACDYLLKNIITNHVAAKIVWISPFHQQWDDTGNSSGIQLSQYIEAIKIKCRKYGVTFIDGFSCSGVNLTPAFVTAMIPDSIHPNAACHELIYKNLMPFFAMM